MAYRTFSHRRNRPLDSSSDGRMSFCSQLTGLGVYRMVTGSTYLMSLVKSGEGHDAFEIVPTAWGFFPYVRRRRNSHANGNGKANGHAKANGKKLE